MNVLWRNEATGANLVICLPLQHCDKFIRVNYLYLFKFVFSLHHKTLTLMTVPLFRQSEHKGKLARGSAQQKSIFEQHQHH